MATTNKTNTTKRTNTTKKTAAPAKQEPAVMVEEVVETKVEEVKPAPFKVTMDMMVDVASTVHGELIWKSQKTGYCLTWGEFGQRNQLSVADLFDMRNGSKGFFENNWVMIEDEHEAEILKYLGVDRYYTCIHHIDDIDDVILNHDAEDIREFVTRLPYTLKEVIAQRAFELVECERLDSAKKIKAIEDATNIRLKPEEE